jgi:hypothetical protein
MMTRKNDIPSLSARVTLAVRQDPRKAGVLAVLVAVMAVMWGRALLNGGSGPRNASAMPRGTTSTSLAGQSRSAAGARSFDRLNPHDPSRASQSSGFNNRVREWLAEPIKPPLRNLFAVRLEYFPRDGGRPGQGIRTAADGEFWGRLEKSLVLQADQRDKRENLLANFKAQAETMRLDSTIMGPVPKALIDGKLVAEGDVVASFRVLKIEPRRIIVEREGIRLEIQMK